MLAEAYSTRRGDEALLVIDQGKDNAPVYMTIGSNPPELAIGGRQVWAVFDPPECQEPVATFFEEDKAVAWSATYAPDSKVGKIDATDKPVVRVAVTALIMRDSKILLGKLKKSGLYVLPEGTLEVSEMIDSAVRRMIKATTGLDVGRISVSKHAPYVNTFIEQAGQHFVSLVMIAEDIGGEPVALDPMWESCGWFDSENPPEPLIITVQQIIDLARRGTAPPPAPLPKNPRLLAVAAAAARAKAFKMKTTKPTKKSSPSRRP